MVLSYTTDSLSLSGFQVNKARKAKVIRGKKAIINYIHNKKGDPI